MADEIRSARVPLDRILRMFRPMELDLQAAYLAVQQDVMDRLDEAVRAGRTPDMLIEEVTAMFDEAEDFNDLVAKALPRVEFQGIPITIENRPGSIRSGEDGDGHEWHTRMRAPYGFIRGSRGVDGDEVDVFLGPDILSPWVYVIHIDDPETGEYDEDKVVLGCSEYDDAMRLVLSHYDKPGFVSRGADLFHVEDFKNRLEEEPGEPLVEELSAAALEVQKSGGSDFVRRAMAAADAMVQVWKATPIGALKVWGGFILKRIAITDGGWKDYQKLGPAPEGWTPSDPLPEGYADVKPGTLASLPAGMKAMAKPKPKPKAKPVPAKPQTGPLTDEEDAKVVAFKNAIEGMTEEQLLAEVKSGAWPKEEVVEVKNLMLKKGWHNTPKILQQALDEGIAPFLSLSEAEEAADLLDNKVVGMEDTEALDAISSYMIDKGYTAAEGEKIKEHMSSEYKDIMQQWIDNAKEVEAEEGDEQVADNIKSSFALWSTNFKKTKGHEIEQKDVQEWIDFTGLTATEIVSLAGELNTEGTWADLPEKLLKAKAGKPQFTSAEEAVKHLHEWVNDHGLENAADMLDSYQPHELMKMFDYAGKNGMDALAGKIKDAYMKKADKAPEAPASGEALQQAKDAKDQLKKKIGDLPKLEVTSELAGLGGSTGGGAKRIKYKDADGKEVEGVLKVGASEGQLRDEHQADALYEILGARTKRGSLYNHGGKLAAISPYLEGWKNATKGTPTQKALIKAKMQEHFVADALLGNWDVTGADFDNVMFKGDEIVRIDNGGSLRYRAMGELKGAAWGPTVVELESMRDPNKLAGQVFAGITDAEVKKQIDKVLAMREQLLDACVEPETKAVLAARLDYLKSWKPKKAVGPAKPKAPAKLSMKPGVSGVQVPIPNAAMKQALSNYKGSGYSSMNAWLRSYETSHGTGSVPDHVKQIDAYLEQCPYQDVDVWRGTGKALLGNMFKGLGFPKFELKSKVDLLKKGPGEYATWLDYFKDWLVGIKFADNGFISTSTSVSTAAAFEGGTGLSHEGGPIMMKIKGKAKAFSFLDALGTHSESEWVLARGTRFVVKDVKVNDATGKASDALLLFELEPIAPASAQPKQEEAA